MRFNFCMTSVTMFYINSAYQVLRGTLQLVVLLTVLSLKYIVDQSCLISATSGLTLPSQNGVINISIYVYTVYPLYVKQRIEGKQKNNQN